MAGSKQYLIVGAALGNCVHVAGVANFLRLANEAGFETRLLGAATAIKKILDTVHSLHPIALAVSYRLTPANGKMLIESLLKQLGEDSDLILLFGGTPDIVKIAQSTGRFTACFTGDESFARIDRVFRLLRGESSNEGDVDAATFIIPVEKRVNALMRAGDKEHFVPLLRHHFGLPDLETTVEGVRLIAESEVLDVISIAPDQNAQEFFFRPDQMNPALDGAGGVPLRRPEHLRRLYEASRYGNFPYLRIYSGTQDLLKWAEMSVRELHNAWGTIPLTWYSELDGRSKRCLEDAIVENLQTIRWYAQRGLPVEINESHQWSLRDSPDQVAIVMAYIAARCAKKMGVRQFFAQYMFNTPSFTSAVSDLAKMAAKVTLIESLRDKDFIPYRQVRAGLSHFATDTDTAKGQLAMATATMLGLRPHILHVVGYAEADHAATVEDVIESCKIVRGVMRNAFLGMPDPLTDRRVKGLYKGLLSDAMTLLGTLERFGRELGSEDPLTDPKVIAKAIRVGILDAPHLCGQPCALGLVRTAPIRGGCRASGKDGQEIREEDRLLTVFKEGPAGELITGDPHRLIGSSDSLPALPPTSLSRQQWK